MPQEALVDAVKEVLAHSPFVGEGHRQVWARLRRQGIFVSRKRVLRVMRENGLLASTRRIHCHSDGRHDGLKASNRRYLEFISSFDDPTKGVKNLAKVTRNVEVANRNYKGLNFFSNEDLDLLNVLAKGEYNIYGLRNQLIRQHLPWSTGKVSRMLKRLRVHGLIKKVGGAYKYYLTKLGKQVIATGLYLKEMLIVPQLASV